MAAQTTIAETIVGPVEYLDVGQGPPILYFHGSGVTGYSMLPFESQLVDDGFRLLLLSRPGYGETPLGENRTAAACSKVAGALLDSLGLEQVAVMGSSGGGAFALSFAINHPWRTKSLVLLGPQLHRWDDSKWLPEASRWTLPFLRRPFLLRLLMKAYRFRFSRITAKQMLKLEAGKRFDCVADNSDALAIAQATVEAMRHGIRFPGFENDMRIFVTEDILNDGAEIESPLLVIHDTCDPMAPMAHIDWISSLVPHCQRLNVETAGHLIWAGPDSEVMHKSRVEFLSNPPGA
jgi:pimeloyl-ACP methyl ester carboxylesterase